MTIDEIAQAEKQVAVTGWQLDDSSVTIIAHGVVPRIDAERQPLCHNCEHSEKKSTNGAQPVKVMCRYCVEEGHQASDCSESRTAELRTYSEQSTYHQSDVSAEMQTRKKRPIVTTGKAEQTTQVSSESSSTRTLPLIRRVSAT